MSGQGGVGRCVIISGLSGAGKTSALNILEDSGFFSVDNMPPVMLPQLISVLSGEAKFTELAVVADVRGGALLDGILPSMEALKKSVPDVKLMFLEASDDWLLRRYELTRRRHPLGDGVSVLDGIAREREMLACLRERADIVMDTSSMLPNDLRIRILSELSLDDSPMSVVVSSFGFKNGLPKDCDYMFDVRFISNPNYVPTLKHLSGRDRDVREYLNRDERKAVFLGRLKSFVKFILDNYNGAVKKQVHIAIGCTGGRHRSVALAEELAEYISAMAIKTVLRHRDIDKEQ
ncbi:nucleotide-binding protein [Synergistales bacterium]|nr:nucleotide-binding protein [Synergistales bacterium]